MEVIYPQIKFLKEDVSSLNFNLELTIYTSIFVDRKQPINFIFYPIKIQ